MVVVIVTSPAGGIPSGSLTVGINGTTVGVYSLNGKGSFTVPVSAALLQSVTVTANYGGSATYAASSGTLNP